MAMRTKLFTWIVCSVSGASACAAAAQPELAYLAVADGYWEVWAANADGSKAKQLTKTGTDKTRVSWYPDGRALLASCNDGTLFKVGLDGKQTRITLPQFPVVDAALAPDGSKIAYSFSTAIDGNDIWVTNSDGTGTRKLVTLAALQHEPVWSRDGTQIYFLSGDGGQAHDIWRASLNGGNTEQLTVGSLYHFDIAVASNGDLAYSSNRSGNYEIYLQRQGAKPEVLTCDPALDGGPVFSPDDNSIVFESTRGGAPNLWRMDLQTRSSKQITHHKEGARAPAWYAGGSK
jgi:TolB protein